MGCLSVNMTRIGGMEATAKRIGGDIAVKMTRVSDFAASITRVGGMKVSFARIGGNAAIRLVQVCKTDIRKPYLRINPEMIWVFPDWAVDNEVFSNTKWKVD